MIGRHLRRLRNDRGLTQPQLAALLQRAGWDISRDTVARIEDQRRWISDFELVFLADVLKVPILELLEIRRGGESAKAYIRRLEHRVK